MKSKNEKKLIALLTNNDDDIYCFRKELIEEIIDGGNHSYYAHYGEQEGDGKAEITRQEQQECVLDVFFMFQGTE